MAKQEPRYTVSLCEAPFEVRVYPALLAAVVTFSGMAGRADVRRKATDLMAFIAAHGLVAAGPLTLARYHPPWTPWFMRRNAVMMPLRH